jgi:hypothetical protein
VTLPLPLLPTRLARDAAGRAASVVTSAAATGVSAAGGAASAAAGTATAVTGAAASALALVPRVEDLLSRTEALVARIEDVATRAEDAVDRTQVVIDGADAAVGRTNAVLGAGEASLRQSQGMLNGGQELMRRGDSLLTQFEQPLNNLLPSLQKFADTLEPHEVEAAITLIDRLPVLLGHVEDDLLPMLTTLDRVGPDVHEILEVVEDLRRVVTGLPGVSLFRRRADEEPEQAVDSGDGRSPERRPRR